MIRPLTRIVTIVLLLATMFPVAAFADGTVIVTVRTDDGRPVSGARVRVAGALITAGTTSERGEVAFDALPTGTYRFTAFRSGYRAQASPALLVDGDLTVTIVIVRSTEPAVIGRVAVSRPSDRDANALSAGRPFSNVLDAPESSLQSAADASSDSPVFVSLEGRPPGETAFSLNGIPLSIPGAPIDLRFLGTGLFSGVTTSLGAQPRGAAGSVDVTTLQPTAQWLTTLSHYAGGYGTTRTSLAEQGSSGKLGFAFAHASNEIVAPLDATRFLDTSGLPYEHHAARFEAGDLGLVRLQPNDETTVSALALDTRREGDLVCLRRSGAVPCGYGPGTTFGGHLTLRALQAAHAHKRWTEEVAGYRLSLEDDSDLAQRLVLGVPAPGAARTSNALAGVAATVRGELGDRFSLTGSANLTHVEVRESGFGADAASQFLPSYAEGIRTFALTLGYVASPTLSATAAFDATSRSNASGVTNGTLALRWRPGTHDAYTVQASSGGFARVRAASDAVSAVPDLVYDCEHGIATGTASSSPGGAAAIDGLRAGWHHGARRSSFDLTLYRTTERDSAVDTLLGPASLPFALPAGYSSQAASYARSQLVCGGGSDLQPRDLFFRTTLAGANVRYAGGTALLRASLGRGFRLSAYYALNEAVAQSASGPLGLADSSFVLGAQLPGVPLHRAGVVTAYESRNWTAAVAMRIVGSNNAQYLPAYAVVDAAAGVPLRRGTLSLVARNAFDAYSGSFASGRFATPVLTRSGAVGFALARPNAPREVGLSYVVSAGADASLRRAPGASDALGSAGAAGSAPQRSANGFLPLPDAPPADPFALELGESACGVEQQRVAAPLLRELRDYVTRIEASKSGDRYPATAPPPPQLPGVSGTYHALGATYALAMNTTRVDVLRAMVACAPIHLGTPEQAAQRGLFVPSGDVPFARLALNYQPEVGLYVVPPTATKPLPQFRVYPLPQRPPADPFALVANPSCTEDFEPTARDALGRLRTLTAAGSGADAVFTIVPHEDGGYRWHEIRSNDLTVLSALLHCAHIAAASPPALAHAGYRGAPPPALNYSTALGLYLAAEL